MREYIEIEKELIPYRFDIEIEEELYTFEVHHNNDFDFFTVDLEKNSEVLAVGEKIVYGIPLFDAIWDERFPSVAIIPYDFSEQNTVVNWNTLNESVFLFIFSEDDADESSE